MDMWAIQLLEIEGTPYEIGYKHGGAFKEKIAGTIQCYREMFKDYWIWNGRGQRNFPPGSWISFMSTIRIIWRNKRRCGPVPGFL